MTYSIIARDLKTGALGVAVASGSIGAKLVPHVTAGVGAVATQGLVNLQYGPEGLQQLLAGRPPDEVVAQLTGADPDAARRQVHLIDSTGRCAGWTGEKTKCWAGHRIFENLSVAGNLLVGPAPLEAMTAVYFSDPTTPFPKRLLLALDAAEAAGGDRRGCLSAALSVAGGPPSLDCRLSVDRHERPLTELRGLMERNETTKKTPQGMLMDVFSRHERGVLAFSGGKDSLTLLDLCEPHRDRVTVAWVNTGVTFPHMVEFIRRVTQGWDFIELRSDQPAWIAQHGLPADLVPTFNSVDGLFIEPERPRLLLQPWAKCCYELRTRPLLQFIECSGATVFLHAQRKADGGGLTNLSGPGAKVEICAPIYGWSDDDVMAYVADHEIELPEQYPELASSLDCWSCPARAVDSPEKHRARMVFMARRYPELYAQLKPVIVEIYKAVHGAFADMADDVKYVLEGDRREIPGKVVSDEPEPPTTE